MKRVDLKPSWRGLPLGIGGLTVLLCIVFLALRSLSMFGPVSLRILFPLMCLGMIGLPWLLLSPHGRYQIGLKFPLSATNLLTGLVLGAAASTLCFFLGYLLFGDSGEHWYASVARSYQAHPVAGASLLQLHLMFTVAACLFSPFGEEIFFRGLLPKVLEQRLSERAATHVQAGVFALAHLCHHGIVATAAGYQLLPLSAALWVALMFGLSWLFALLRRSADSLLPAIVAHAAFNAVMNCFIFAYFWNR